MRKMISLLMLTFSLTLTSCINSAQLIEDEAYFTCTYFDYGYNLPIVYINAMPYYRIWSVDHWFNRPVPRERYGYIHRFDRPMTLRRPDMPPRPITRDNGFRGMRQQQPMRHPSIRRDMPKMQQPMQRNNRGSAPSGRQGGNRSGVRR